nr:immunoglobulin heavy chain junction region [Mus musculus]
CARSGPYAMDYW